MHVERKHNSDLTRQDTQRLFKEAFVSENLTWFGDGYYIAGPNSPNVNQSEQVTSDSGEYIVSIGDLKREIESLLKKLSKVNANIIEYLVELQGKYTEADDSNQRHYKEIISRSMLIAIIWVIAKKMHRHRAPKEKDDEWRCIDQLLSRNHANIRMADLRTIINKYYDKLGHIKTAGRGRTKIKIISDLTAFQNASVV